MQKKICLNGTYEHLGDNLKEGYGTCGCIDVETTGLSFDNDEIIELALVLFEYDRKTGIILKIIDEYVGLREPTCLIGRDAYNTHGLDKNDLQEKELDMNIIISLLKKAELLVSHNAMFDYNFMTPLLCDTFAIPWYCSMNGINWRGEGFYSKGLQNLLVSHGLKVTQAHRALDDARAVVALLGQFNKEGKPYLRKLLENGPHIVPKFTLNRDINY